MQHRNRRTRVAVWQRADLVSVASGLLALVALALVALALVARRPNAGQLMLLWGALEASLLLPLLPLLLEGWPPTARAAAREAQVGAAGRALLWLALGAGLTLGSDWSLRALPGHALVLLAALVALPAALNWGPFGPLPGLGVAGGTTLPAQLARLLRWAALLATTLAAILPLLLLPPAARLALVAGVVLLALLVLQRLRGLWPRLTLPAALRLCWQRGLPLAIAAIIYAGVLTALQ